MKRIGNLYDEIISIEKLKLADEKARRNKTKTYGVMVHDKRKDELHQLLHDIRAYLQRLRLKVKRNYQVFPVDSRGIDFLGYVFFHTHTLLRKKIKKSLPPGGKAI